MMRVVICGGGIVGVCTAYFLARIGVEPIVVERCGLACAASGKGGGFLAANWCDGTPLEPLARRSFDLHARLAVEVDGDWGYRRLDTFGGASSAEIARARSGQEPAWLGAGIGPVGRLGTPADTAQVHPGQFTTALMRAAKALGAGLRHGAVTGVLRDAGGRRARGVLVDGEPLEADKVVIAMGPWSRLARRWLPLPEVYALKGHSLVFETDDDLPPEAVFLDHRDGGGTCAPEIFPRADGTTYICAINSDAPLPDDPAAVTPDPGALDRLEAIAAHAAPRLGRSAVLARQACYRPVTRDGLPLIGRVPRLADAFVATGHGVWGILNAPATGEAMAELIVDGRARTTDLAPFDPARFGTM